MNLKKRTLVVLAGLSAAVGLLAGCGGSSSSESNSTPPAAATSAGAGSDQSVSKQLPAAWPADIPKPTGLTLINSVTLPNAMSATYNGPGTEAAMKTQMYPGMEAAGWKEKSGLDGGVTVWEKGSQRMQMTMLPRGAEIGVGMTIVDTSAGAN